MSVQIEEQETHVSFLREDSRAVIYTSDTTMMTKLNKLVEAEGTEWKRERETHLQKTGELIGVFYSCPVEFISFRSKRVNRTYTDEERQKIAERLLQSRV